MQRHIRTLLSWSKFMNQSFPFASIALHKFSPTSLSLFITNIFRTWTMNIVEKNHTEQCNVYWHLLSWKTFTGCFIKIKITQPKKICFWVSFKWKQTNLKSCIILLVFKSPLTIIFLIHRQQKTPKKNCQRKMKRVKKFPSTFIFRFLFLSFPYFNDQQLQEKQLLIDIPKKFTFSLYSQPRSKKTLGNFCKLYTRDNWFDWNETKIWGNIEKWKRAKVRSVYKQQKQNFDWPITHSTLNNNKNIFHIKHFLLFWFSPDAINILISCYNLFKPNARAKLGKVHLFPKKSLKT